MHNGYASSAGNSDTVDGYHASGLLTALSNSNNGISITVGGTTKSISNISVNYAASAGNADTVDGYHVNGSNVAPYGRIPVIKSDGVMEVGKYINFHNDNSGKYDFSTRLQTTGNYVNIVNLPSASGTLALTSNIPTSLKSPYSLSWNGYNSGSYDGSSAKSFTIPDKVSQLTNDSGYETYSDRFTRVVTNANDIYNPFHTYETNGGSNMPNNSSWHQIFTWGTGDMNYCFQLANDYVSNNHLYFRYKCVGTWYDWKTVIDSSNIGSQSVNYANSAGNADTVDGEHASNFSYTHQTSFDFSKSKSGRIVTFDESNTNYGWINGFASTHNNYLTSVIFNTHRTSNWYVGYIEATTSTGVTKGLTAVKQLAFLDSNVASATKLQTPRTIWGQSFDGTNNIGGTILPSATHTYNLGSTTYVFEKTYTRYVDTDNTYDLHLSCTGIEVLRLAATDKSANINYNANISGNLSVNGLISNKGILPTNYEFNNKGTNCYVSADALCSGITAITDSIPVNQVTVQYSNDNGNSWTNYPMSNDTKFNLYANNAGLNQIYLGYNVITGNNDAEKLAQIKKNQLMFTFYIPNNCYSQIYFASVDISNGINTICTVEILNNSGTVIGTYTKRMAGWNQINYISLLDDSNLGYGVGNNDRRYIRFKFKHDQKTTALRNTVIDKIRIFSFTKYSFPGDRFMGHTGHIYNFDYNMNTYFPNSILAKGGVTAYQSSDVRLKTNITKLNCLNVIKSIGGTYEFDYIRDHKHSIGFIAQNVNNPLLNDIVAKDDNGYLKINYWNPKLISLAFGALTEIDDEVDKLKARVRELESEVEYLKNKDYALQ